MNRRIANARAFDRNLNEQMTKNFFSSADNDNDYDGSCGGGDDDDI